jgi:hypothetical protein
MSDIPNAHGIFAHAEFTVTGFLYLKCGHLNNLKRRRKPAALRGTTEKGKEKP